MCYHNAMDADSKVVEFVSFCIEMYAREYDMSGSDVAAMFEKYALIDYLFSNYEGLHSQGKELIVSLLHDFVEKKEVSE